jgi:Fic family protein
LSQQLARSWAAALDAGITRRARQPCRYEAYLPDPLARLPVNLPADVAADVSDAERAVQSLNANGPELASLEALAHLLLRAESVASSRIEGLEVGVGRLARAEAAKQLGETINDVTAEAVLGNIAAMELAVSQLASKRPLELEDLLSIHRALMRHTGTPELGGQVRTVQNWIGGNDYNPCGAEFVPPPPEFVGDLLEDLVAFLDSEDSPPLVQAAIAYAQFETIHPFADGNGRVGRALIHLVLRRRGLAPRYVPPISLVLAIDSRNYIAGLGAFRYVGAPTSPAATQGIANWIATFASATARAVDEARQLASDVHALGWRWRSLAAPLRKNSAADRLLRVLPAAPIIAVSTAAQLTGRSFQAADLAIARLTKAGVLRQTRLGRRNRAFEAVGLLDTLTVIERRWASPARDTRVSAPVRRAPRRLGKLAQAEAIPGPKLPNADTTGHR